jgi:hypothetical protein
MAGVLLPALVPLGAESSTISRPLLALVGGFSAGLVYTILQRLVDVVGSLFQGTGSPPRPVADPLALPVGGKRLALVAELTKLGEQLRTAGTADAAAAIDGVLRTLLPDQLGDEVELGDLQTVAQAAPPTNPASITT